MLVLEFMEGGDLWSALRGPHREELQWYGRGRALALDIARGLHFLHEHKVGFPAAGRNLSLLLRQTDQEPSSDPAWSPRPPLLSATCIGLPFQAQVHHQR